MRTIWIALLAFLSSSAFAQERVLIVVPHPDDETLGIGGTLQHLVFRRSHGEDISYRVVLMTCGDSFEAAYQKWLPHHPGKTYVDFGVARHDETVKAMGRLGVGLENLTFLGFPDSLLTQILDSDVAVKNPHTGTAEVPYPFAFRFHAPYTRRELVQELTEILNQVKPTLLYTPTLSDHHPDHSGTEKIVDATLTAMGLTVPRREYLIHWDTHDPAWPYNGKPWGVILGHQKPDFIEPLTAAEQTLKSEAISDYATQLPVVYDYLHGFAKSSEVFWNHRARLEDYWSQP